MKTLIDDARKGLHAAKDRLKLAYELRCVCEDTATERAIHEAKESLQWWNGYMTGCVIAMQYIEDAKCEPNGETDAKELLKPFEN
jgi:hypothetical protein